MIRYKDQTPSVQTQISYLGVEITKLDNHFWENYATAKENGEPIPPEDAVMYHERFINLKLFLLDISRYSKTYRTQKLIREQFISIVEQIEIIKNWFITIGIPMVEETVVQLNDFRK